MGDICAKLRCSRLSSVAPPPLKTREKPLPARAPGPSVHVSVDLLQQRVQGGVRLRLLDHLHQLCVLRDQLPQVCHLLQEFGEEEGVVRMVVLEMEFEHVHNPLLHFLNVSYV